MSIAPRALRDLVTYGNLMAWLLSRPRSYFFSAESARDEEMLFEPQTQMANPLARYLQAQGYPGAWVDNDFAAARPPFADSDRFTLPGWAKAAMRDWRDLRASATIGAPPAETITIDQAIDVLYGVKGLVVDHAAPAPAHQ